jgi:predicted PurR-regulated permease PerM
MAGATHQNRDRVRTISFYAALGLVAYLLYVIAKPFLVPLCAAAILVVFFYPWHVRAERRYGKRPAALLSTALVTTILIVPAVLVITAFVREATAAAASLQDAAAAGQLAGIGRWWARLQQQVPGAAGVTLSEVASDVGRRFGGAAAETAGGILQDVGIFIFDLVVVIFAMFFLFRDARPIMAMVRRVLPFEEEQRELVIRQAHEIIRASVISSLLVASAQGAAGGLLFWMLGMAAPVFWGVLMAFFSLLPVVGPWVIWLPAGLWLLVNGAVGKGILLLALGAGVVSTIDNVLRPSLMSGRAQMNGLLVLISLLGGIGAFGLIGVVIGPVIVATMASLLSAYTGPPGRDADPAAPGDERVLS